MKKEVAIILSFILCGCSTITVPDSFVYKEVPTENFTIATWQKITNPQSVYKIYIEGDGHAFNAYGYPTQNPTPKGTLVRKLAFGDTAENVVYLARPCQYVKDSACFVDYWTTARFSHKIVDAEYAVIKEIAGNNPVILVGFSGGAQITGLLAVKYADLNVNKVITIAGNLDHKAWTDYHHLPELDKSMNLADFKADFDKIEQIHYVGEDDKIIPPILTQKFVKNKNLVVVIKNATHADGWDNIFNKIYSEN